MLSENTGTTTKQPVEHQGVAPVGGAGGGSKSGPRSKAQDLRGPAKGRTDREISTRCTTRSPKAEMGGWEARNDWKQATKLSRGLSPKGQQDSSLRLEICYFKQYLFNHNKLSRSSCFHRHSTCVAMGVWHFALTCLVRILEQPPSSQWSTKASRHPLPEATNGCETERQHPLPTSYVRTLENPRHAYSTRVDLATMSVDPLLVIRLYRCL